MRGLNPTGRIALQDDSNAALVYRVKALIDNKDKAVDPHIIGARPHPYGYPRHDVRPG